MPSFSKTGDSVLYVLSKGYFPARDMLWESNHTLYVVNATRKNSGSKDLTGIESFLNDLKVPIGTKVLIVPKPNMFQALNVDVTPEAEKLVTIRVDVLEIPVDYVLSRLGQITSVFRQMRT